MENKSVELCPICIDKSANYYTECGHGYCIECLSKIKKCAMCRNNLQMVKICNQIKNHNLSHNNYTFELSGTNMTIIIEPLLMLLSLTLFYILYTKNKDIKI